MLFTNHFRFRYCPVLASLQFQHLCIRILVSVYFIANLVQMAYQDNSYLYLLTFINKISLLNQTEIYESKYLWSILECTVKNMLYYGFNGYICAELITRVFYDSIYSARKRNKSIWDVPPRREIDQYSFTSLLIKKMSEKAHDVVTSGGNTVVQNENASTLVEEHTDSANETIALMNPNGTSTRESVNEQGCWSKIQKFLLDKFRKFRKDVTGIYTWDEIFRYTTIVICTYAIAYVLLAYLTFNLIFFYTTGKTNYMTYFKQLVERILNISMFIEIR